MFLSLCLAKADGEELAASLTLFTQVRQETSKLSLVMNLFFRMTCRILHDHHVTGSCFCQWLLQILKARQKLRQTETVSCTGRQKKDCVSSCSATSMHYVSSNKPKGDNVKAKYAQLSEYSIQRGQSKALCSLSHKFHCIITDAVACHSVAVECDRLRVWNPCCESRRNTVGTSGQSETESAVRPRSSSCRCELRRSASQFTGETRFTKARCA